MVVLVVQGRRRRDTLVSSISGETGGLSESDPPPLRGPLLWESRPEVSGDTSYVQVQPSEARKLSQPQIQHTSRRRKQESIVQQELNMNIKRLSVLSVFGSFAEK